MKQPKKLKREYKEVVSAYHLNPDNWMLQEDGDKCITIIHKITGNTRLLDKFARATRKFAIILAFFLIFAFSTETAAEGKETFISEKTMGYCEIYGSKYGICPELLMAIAETESSGNPRAENGDCKGIMQVSESFHKERMERLGVSDIFNESGNILVATDYLLELFEKYEDVGVVLMVYNGDSNAEKYMNGTANLSKYAQKILERSMELERIHGK